MDIKKFLGSYIMKYKGVQLIKKQDIEVHTSLLFSLTIISFFIF